VASPVFSSGKEFQPNAKFEQMNQPVTAEQLQAQFELPSPSAAELNRMTYEGTISKTALIVIGTMIAAVPGYLFPNPLLYMISGIVGFVMALVVIFKKTPNPALIAVYAIAEGYFLGALTTWVEVQFNVPGAGLQALTATFITFGVVLALYRSGKLRYTNKMRKFLLIGGLSYLLFSLANMFYMWFGPSKTAWGMRTGADIMGIPLGVFIGAFAVVLACVSLVADFDFIENAVKNGAPKHVEWKAAFGLVLTLVWLYIEFLRIIAILFGRR
jgi:uncharacterized YccA/Bax inhibitor family protein